MDIFQELSNLEILDKDFELRLTFFDEDEKENMVYVSKNDENLVRLNIEEEAPIYLHAKLEGESHLLLENLLQRLRDAKIDTSYPKILKVEPSRSKCLMCGAIPKDLTHTKFTVARNWIPYRNTWVTLCEKHSRLHGQDVNFLLSLI